MKKLVCEMCGGSAFVKEGGLFVCKTCGMSYSPEDAKSIMVDVPDGETASPASDAGISTVRVDRTEELNNRIRNVKVEYDNSNLDDVKRLCQDILNIDPDYYEAIVYKALAAGWQSSIADPKIVTASKELRRANGILRTQQPDNVNFTQSCLFPLKELGRIAAAFFATHEKHYNKRKSDSNSYAAKYEKGQSELWGYVGSSVYYSANDRINGYLDTANKIEREAVDTYNGGCETVCIAVMNYIIEICNSLGKDHHYCDGFLDEMQNCLDVCDGYLTTDGVLEQYRSVLMHIFGLKIEAQNTYWADHPEEKAAHDRKLQKEKEEKERKELEEKKKAYSDAVNACENAADLSAMEAAVKSLADFTDFEDGKTKYDIYMKKLTAMQSAEAERLERERLEREAAEKERKAKRNKRLLIGGIVTAALILLAVGFYFLNQKVLQPTKQYKAAVAQMENEQYGEAIIAFQELNGYKDSDLQIEKCRELQTEATYQTALSLMEEEKYDDAIDLFQTLGDYKDSKEQISAIQYEEAVSLMDEKAYAAAAMAFTRLSGYKDAAALADTCFYRSGLRKTIAAGYTHTVALKVDGTAIAVGTNEDGECIVSSWKDIIAVTVGSYNSAGLRADGTVTITGYFNSMFSATGWKDIVAIDFGDQHIVGLKKDGTVVAAGLNDDGQCDVSDWTDIIAIAAGNLHTVGLKKDGTVVATGSSHSHQTSVYTWTDIVAIAAGTHNTLGLKKDGSVIATGYDTKKQSSLSDWKDLVMVDAGYEHSVGLKPDGTLIAKGSNSGNQCDVSEWRDVVAISVGYGKTVGLKKDGTVLITGKGNSAAEKETISGWTGIKIP